MKLRNLIKETLKIMMAGFVYVFVWWIINITINGNSNFEYIVQWGVWFIVGSMLYVMGLMTINSGIGFEIKKYIRRRLKV